MSFKHPAAYPVAFDLAAILVRSQLDPKPSITLVSSFPDLMENRDTSLPHYLKRSEECKIILKLHLNSLI